MKSSSAWSSADRSVKSGDPAPFNGVVMTTENYTKVYQELEACDIWKKYLKNNPVVESTCDREPSSFKFALFLGGILTGVILNESVR